MPMRLMIAFLVSGMALAAGCASPQGGVAWQSHRALRAQAANGRLGHVDAKELLDRKIRSGIDYLTLRLDSVFLRDLPGSKAGKILLLGVEIEGLLEPQADGVHRVIKLVAPEMHRCEDDVCASAFRHVMRLRPLRYSGRPITLTLVARLAGDDEARSFAARLDGLRDLVRNLDPLKPKQLETARRLFDATIDAAGRSSANWRYEVTLHPSDGPLGADLGAMLTASRHVLVAVRPIQLSAAKRATIRDVQPEELALKDHGLYWADGQRPYSETPYLVLDVGRAHRDPDRTARMKSYFDRLETLFESNLAATKSQLNLLGLTLANDTEISVPERHLYRSLGEEWKERLAVAQAMQASDAAAERKHLEAQYALLIVLRERFEPILDAGERQVLSDRLKTVMLKVDAFWSGSAPTPTIAALVARAKTEGQVAAKKASAEQTHIGAIAQRPQPAIPAGRTTAPRAIDVDVVVRVPMLAGESEEKAIEREGLRAARQAALLKALPGTVPRDFTGCAKLRLENAQLARSFSKLMSNAELRDEDPDHSVETDAAGGRVLKMRLRAKVYVRPPRSDPGFGVTVALPKNTFKHGETTAVSVRPTRDSYIYLFNVDSEGQVTALVPNAAEKVPLVKGGAEYKFPSEELWAKGVVARASLPPGSKLSHEVMKVIAVRASAGKPPLALLQPHPGGAAFVQHGAKSTELIGEVLCKLAAQDPDSWTDGRAEFTVLPADAATATPGAPAADPAAGPKVAQP